MNNSLVDLSKYRISQAEQCIKSAKLLAEHDDYFIISKEDVRQQISNAERFLKDIESYLLERYEKMK